MPQTIEYIVDYLIPKQEIIADLEQKNQFQQKRNTTVSILLLLIGFMVLTITDLEKFKFIPIVHSLSTKMPSFAVLFLSLMLTAVVFLLINGLTWIVYSLKHGLGALLLCSLLVLLMFLLWLIKLIISKLWKLFLLSLIKLTL